MRRKILTAAMIAFAALFGVAIWAVRTFARRDIGTDASASAGATVTAIDSTWCGSQLGAPIADAGDCGKLALTGSAPGCLSGADCAHDPYELVSTSSGPGRCRCEGGPKPPILVSYDEKFCALD